MNNDSEGQVSYLTLILRAVSVVLLLFATIFAGLLFTMIFEADKEPIVFIRGISVTLAPLVVAEFLWKLDQFIVSVKSS